MDRVLHVNCQCFIIISFRQATNLFLRGRNNFLNFDNSQLEQIQVTGAIVQILPFIRKFRPFSKWSENCFIKNNLYQMRNSFTKLKQTILVYTWKVLKQQYPNQPKLAFDVGALILDIENFCSFCLYLQVGRKEMLWCHVYNLYFSISPAAVQPAVQSVHKHRINLQSQNVRLQSCLKKEDSKFITQISAFWVQNKNKKRLMLQKIRKRSCTLFRKNVV